MLTCGAAPTSVIHQIYPYKDNQGNVTTSDTGNGNYNCFLYCEMVTGNSLPQSLQLGYSGNFCYPPSNTTAGDNSMFCPKSMLNRPSTIPTRGEFFSGGNTSKARIQMTTLRGTLASRLTTPTNQPAIPFLVLIIIPAIYIKAVTPHDMPDPRLPVRLLSPCCLAVL